jgi:hypothetical protein
MHHHILYYVFLDIQDMLFYWILKTSFYAFRKIDFLALKDRQKGGFQKCLPARKAANTPEPRSGGPLDSAPGWSD